MKFEIKVRETYEKTFVIEADSEEEAQEILGDGEINMVPEDYVQDSYHIVRIKCLDKPKILIKPEDVKYETYRNITAKVNDVETNIRATHLPSGLVVDMDKFKSLHQNKEKAFEKLNDLFIKSLENEL